MKRRVVIDKQVGETPLMALERWKVANPAYAAAPASYAGRLDPMASGKLLILLGDECKRQKDYTKLDKEYEIEVLLEVGSDTGDALGLVEYTELQTPIESQHLVRVLNAEIGSHTRSYPSFSSKTVNGKPLFLHALEGTTSSITIPTHEEHIYSIAVQQIVTISSAHLAAHMKDFLTKVPRSNESSKQLGADFRIDAVRTGWEKLMRETGQRAFIVLKLRVACGSGTYMRSLAGRIGEAFGTRALALSINRTKIGRRWRGWWIKQF